MADIPKLRKLALSVAYMKDRFKNGDFGDILIRIVVFLVLVFITHWALKTIFMQIAIRIMKYYFHGPIMNLLMARFGPYAGEIQGKLLSWL